MQISTIDWSILLPACVAGILVLATHLPLGAQVLRKGIVFIDLAIAQVASVGVVAAGAMGFEPHGVAVQASALLAALAASFALTLSERFFPEIQEALIGTLFVVASCIGLILLASNPQGSEHLKDLLIGQILWVTWPQIAYMGLVTIVVLTAWYGIGLARLGRFGFYALFALAVTASVQLVGVFLVFASLIMPALAVRPWVQKKQVLASWIVGILGYAVGVVLSAQLDLPTGAVIVLAMAGVAILAAILGKRLS